MSTSMITVKVRTVSHQEMVFKVNKDIQLNDLKTLIAEQSGVQPDLQRLIFKGKVLKTDQPISTYGVEDGNVIHLVSMSPQAFSSAQSTSSSSTPTPTQSTTTTQARPVQPPRRNVIVSQFTVNNDSGNVPDLNQLVTSALNRVTGITANQNEPQVVVNNVQSNNNSISTLSTNLHQLVQQFDTHRTNIRRMSQLLEREAQLTRNERSELSNLRARLEPILNNLTNLSSQSQQLTANLSVPLEGRSTIAPVTTTSTQQNERTDVAGFHLHLHANANEIDNLPQQIARLRQTVNLPGDIRVTTTPINQPTAPQQRRPDGPSLDFGQIIQNVGPMLSNIISSVGSGVPPSQAQQQDNAPQRLPTNIMSTMMNAVNQASDQATTPDRQQDPSVASVVRNMTSGFGITESPDQSGIDELVKVIIENLGLSDMMALVSGNWTCLERVQEPVRKYVVEVMLKNDTSEASRSKVIEELMAGLEKHLTENEELMAAINERMRSGAQVPVLEIVEVSRTYMALLIAVIVDGVDATLAGIGQNILSISGDNTAPFATALQQITTLYIGETIDILAAVFTNGTQDIPPIITLLTKKMMSGIPENLQAFYNTMGATMVVQFLMRRYQVYKQQHPNRPLSRTPAPQPSAEQKTQSTSESEPKPTEVQQPAVQIPVTTARQTTPVTTPSPSTPSSTATRTTPQLPWTRGLTDEEIELISSTISEDVLTLRSTYPQSPSNVYENGSKGKQKAEKNSGSGSGGEKSEEEEELADDLD